MSDTSTPTRRTSKPRTRKPTTRKAKSLPTIASLETRLTAIVSRMEPLIERLQDVFTVKRSADDQVVLILAGSQLNNVKKFADSIGEDMAFLRVDSEESKRIIAAMEQTSVPAKVFQVSMVRSIDKELTIAETWLNESEAEVIKTLGPQ